MQYQIKVSACFGYVHLSCHRCPSLQEGNQGLSTAQYMLSLTGRLCVGAEAGTGSGQSAAPGGSRPGSPPLTPEGVLLHCTPSVQFQAQAVVSS